MKHFKFLLAASDNRCERGFSLLSAIFILVALAALAAAVVTVSTSHQRGEAADVLGSRAYAAARAGLEWGMYQVNSSSTTSPNTPFCTYPTGTLFTTVQTCFNSRTCPGGTGTVHNFTLPTTAATFTGLTVTVKCTLIPDPGGYSGPNVYEIESWACNQPSSTATQACPLTSNLGTSYVERYVRVFM
ncbi:MAG: hypothetical protein P4L91_19140 [Burkholderiaceae bacterium]|nr:hypothetical protein [Burkholderiaceae bacterium]